MSSRKRPRLSLAPVILEAAGSCDCCFTDLDAGEVVIGFGGALVDPQQTKTFCLDCVSGVLLEANGNARAQRRARPIHVFVKKQGTNEVVTTIELTGGVVQARRALGGLSQKVDFDRFWLDLSELEARERATKQAGR